MAGSDRGRKGCVGPTAVTVAGSMAVRPSSLIETFGTPRMGSAFTGAISAEPGVLVVGTGPAEWWDNPDDLLRAMQVQSAELQGAAATVSQSEGWIEGEVGWGAVQADIVFPDGRSAC